MKTSLSLFAQARSISVPAWMIILALPCANLISVFVLRDHAGPFWMWSNLDPDYWYLLDSLNMVNLNWPVHIAHPGTPLQVLGAILIKTMHPLATAEQITELVLSNPEKYLHVIFSALVVLNTIALAFLGLCGYLVFNDRVVVVLLQIGPFISKLSLKWMSHVAPEPLLIFTVLILGGVALLALRPGNFEENKNKFAIAFGVIAGFGMATKITSIGIYFLPVILLWGTQSLLVFAFAGLISIVFFTLPAAGSYGEFIGHINNISVGSLTPGEIKKPFIDFAQYPKQLVRVSSRPAFFIVFIVSFGLVGYLWLQSKFRGKPFPLIARLLAGLCIADIVQALIVAKHPSGHYMIPVLVLSSLGLALIYRTFVTLRAESGGDTRYISGFFCILGIGLVVSQSLTYLKLDTQFRQRTVIAGSVDDTRFNKCARIFFWSASDPSYALQLGDNMVGNPFAKTLEHIRPTNDFWIEVQGTGFRDWRGPRDLKKVTANYPCIYARGTHPGNILPLFKEMLPTHVFSIQCSAKARHETILTSGVDCQGNLQ